MDKLQNFVDDELYRLYSKVHWIDCSGLVVRRSISLRTPLWMYYGRITPLQSSNWSSSLYLQFAIQSVDWRPPTSLSIFQTNSVSWWNFRLWWSIDNQYWLRLHWL